MQEFFCWSHFVFCFYLQFTRRRQRQQSNNISTHNSHVLFFSHWNSLYALCHRCDIVVVACFLFLTCFVTATTKMTATLMMRTETLLDRHSKAAMKLGFFFLNERHSDVSFSSIILKSKQQVSGREPVYLHLFLFYFCVFLILLHEV